MTKSKNGAWAPSRSFAAITRIRRRIGEFYERSPLGALLVLYVLCLLVTVPGAILGLSGAMRPVDNMLEDALYASPAVKGTEADSRIVLIGINEEDIMRFGAWGSDIGIIASMVEAMNADASTAPAAIGISGDFSASYPESDLNRMVAASAVGNVVMACRADLEQDLVVCDDSLTNHRFATGGYSAPTEELAEVVTLGHTNVLYDSDGVLRHHLYSVRSVNGEYTLSFGAQCYNVYCKNQGVSSFPDMTVSNDGIVYLSYACTPGGYTRYSLSDLMDGKVPADALADKIVMVGPYTTSLDSGEITSADRSKTMFAIEHQANMTDAMLNNRMVSEIDLGLQIFIYILATATMLFLWILQPLSFILIEWVVFIVADLGVSRLLWMNGYACHPLFILTSCVICVLLPIVLRLIELFNREQRAFMALNRYLDNNVVNELLDDGTSAEMLAGTRAAVAVMFADIRGFTTFSEGARPEDLVQVLSQYLSIAGAKVHENGGTLDKYIGDCAMAFWGAPEKCSDPAYRACRAALDIVQAVEDARPLFSVEGSAELHFGIGIHFGEVVVGNIGSDERMDFTIIGDTVNTAERIESVAPKGKVLISRDTLKQLGKYAVVAPFSEQLAIKGKTQPVDVFMLEGLIEKEEEDEMPSISVIRPDGKGARRRVLLGS